VTLAWTRERRYHRPVRIHCPICRRDRDIADDAPHRPFCSARCKTIDLGNWLSEAYRISQPIDLDDTQSAEDDKFSVN